MAMPLVKKAVPALATGALSGLASLGVDKIFGKGKRGGYIIPLEKIPLLGEHTNHLSKKKCKCFIYSGSALSCFS